MIGSTSSPSDWACAGYAGNGNGNGSVSNISNDTYYALADQWGLNTTNSPYKDIVDTMLGIGGFNSFTNVSIYGGYATADFNQSMGLHNITPTIPQGYAPSDPSLNGNNPMSGKGGALDITTSNQFRIMDLQLMLRSFGYTDNNGNVMTIEGSFGPNTIALLIVAGKYVQVWSFDGSTITQYMHLSAIGIQDGQIVAAGDTIGAMGDTGGPRGTHLHFGVQIYNERSGRYDYIDPLQFLPVLP